MSENLEMVNTVPEDIDHSPGAPVYLPVEQVEFAARPPILCRFNRFGQCFASRQEAGYYLRDARIALLGKLPNTHPLVSRTQMDGSLKA